MKKYMAMLLVLLTAVMVFGACSAAPATTDGTAAQASVQEEPAEEPAADYDMFSQYWTTTEIPYETLDIDGVPAIVWGKSADKVILAIQGMYGCKEDAPNVILAEVAQEYGYQVISIDLPGHGVRAENSDWVFDDCAADVRKVLDYAQKNYQSVSMQGDSFGAYMILTVCKDAALERRMFTSPAVDMQGFMEEQLMPSANVTLEQLETEQVVSNDVSFPFRWDNHLYMVNNPIDSCPKPTYILYNENDELFSNDLVKGFVDQYGCELTVFPGGEHWLHTPEQLDFYRIWVTDILSK